MNQREFISDQIENLIIMTSPKDNWVDLVLILVWLI
jgi:hypothetical protein